MCNVKLPVCSPIHKLYYLLHNIQHTTYNTINVPVFLPDMVRSDMTPEHQVLMQGRQLQALQLMFLLLPRENMQLLDCLLNLLYRVVQEPANKMTADTLGTLFAPHIMVPRKVQTLTDTIAS